jgi:hypothetical protein
MATRRVVAMLRVPSPVSAFPARENTPLSSGVAPVPFGPVLRAGEAAVLCVSVHCGGRRVLPCTTVVVAA